MRITARFDGRCAKCGKPTLKGTEIDYENKQARHPECCEEDETAPSDEQLAIADRLGFKRVD